jgi:hypothetical protein
VGELGRYSHRNLVEDAPWRVENVRTLDEYLLSRAEGMDGIGGVDDGEDQDLKSMAELEAIARREVVDRRDMKKGVYSRCGTALVSNDYRTRTIAIRVISRATASIGDVQQVEEEGLHTLTARQAHDRAQWEYV